MKIFFETSAIIAFFIKDENLHQKVVDKYQFYKQIKAVFLTSEYVLDELFTWILNRFGKKLALQAVRFFQEAEKNNAIKIFNIDTPLFKKALELFIKYSEHKISFTDITSYVLCKELAADEIFTLDSDFKRLRLKTSF